MGDEAVVGVAVDPRHVVHAESTVGGPAAGDLADVRFLLHLAGGAQVVLHVEADVVAADLFAPILAESGRPTAVRENDDVALRGHQPVVPAVAPPLAERTLRASKEDLDRRIGLRRVELGRVEDPCEHLLAVDSLHETLLGLVGVKLSDNVPVLIRNPGEGAALFVDRDQFCRKFHRAVAGEEGALDSGERRVEVIPGIIRSDADRGGGDVKMGAVHSGCTHEGVDLVDGLEPFRQGVEIDDPRVVGPDRTGGIVLEG